MLRYTHQKRKHPEQLEISVRYDMRAGVTQGAELCKGQKKRNNLCVAVEKKMGNQKLLKIMEDMDSLKQFLWIATEEFISPHLLFSRTKRHPRQT